MDDGQQYLFGEVPSPPSNLQRSFPGREPPPVPPVPLHLHDSEELRGAGRGGQEAGAAAPHHASRAPLQGPSRRSPTEADIGLNGQDINDIRSMRELQEKKEAELLEHAKRLHGDVRRRPSVEDAELTTSRKMIDGLISHWAFDAFIGACICFNAVTIGIESTYSNRGQGVPTWLQLVEYSFLVVYATELGLRVFVHRLQAFTAWVRFDAFLVVCGVLDIIVNLALTESPEALANVMLIRMMRLARLARAARLVVQFKVLWLLCSGLMNSVLTIMWTFVIIFVLIYIFAIAGMEIFRPDESAGEEYQEAAAKFNEGLGVSLLTLVQFLTLDSIGGIYVPICIAKPWLTLYFAAFILLVSVALMNLVTALMVDSALSQSSQDKEAEKAWEAAKRKKALPKLKAMFIELDEDGSGELELEELRNAPEDLKEQLQEISNGADPEELFHMLDYDGSGSIEVDEFCEGVLKVSANDKPMELLRIMRQCGAIQDSSKKALQILEDMESNGVSGGGGSGRGGGGGGGAGGADRYPPDKRGGGAPTIDSGCSTQVTTADCPEAIEALEGRMGDVEARLAGVECRLSGIELNLQRIAEAVGATGCYGGSPMASRPPMPGRPPSRSSSDARKRSQTPVAGARPPSRPSSDAGGRPPVGGKQPSRPASDVGLGARSNNTVGWT